MVISIIDAQSRRTRKANKSNFNTGLSAGKKNTKKLLFFRSPVAVRLSISTKVCKQIEEVSTIFATDYYWIRFLVFALGPKTLLWFFQCENYFFVINPSFMNRILPKLKHRYRQQSSFNVVSFIIFDQGIRRHAVQMIFPGIF